jgi:crossover junction endodeoxyribonuclease RuvC
MEVQVKILGIDPGLHLCGYACIEVDGNTENLVEAGVIRIRTSLPLPEKLNQIAEDIQTIIEKLAPQVVAVEELYSHYAHPRTAILMGHARGVILQKMAAAGVAIKSFSATRIKKSLTGNGRASKEQVQRTIQTLLALPQLPEPPDVADAIAAALCCATTMTHIIDTTTGRSAY